MNGKSLAKLYRFNAMVIDENLAGFTEEDALFQPEPLGNCANWILGHIIANRNTVMKLVGENPIWNEEESHPYRRGSDPLTDGTSAIPLERMITELKSSQEKLFSILLKMSTEELEAAVEDTTLYDYLAALQFHEAYHAGQLGILRRLIGKPGAIK